MLESVRKLSTLACQGPSWHLHHPSNPIRPIRNRDIYYIRRQSDPEILPRYHRFYSGLRGIGTNNRS